MLFTNDGVGNMSGEVKTAAEIFCSEIGNDKTVYLYCAPHELDLCLLKDCARFFIWWAQCKFLESFSNTLQSIKEYLNFPSPIFFNDINHGYRAAIPKRNSLWLLPLFMALATYCCYAKVSRTMLTAIVLYLLK